MRQGFRHLGWSVGPRAKAAARAVSGAGDGETHWRAREDREREHRSQENKQGNRMHRENVMKTNSRRFSPRFVSALVAVVWWSLALVLAPTQGPAAVLPNTLVNNPGADATARDSQQETTIALGLGNSIFSAYVDTGSWDGTPGGIQ